MSDEHGEAPGLHGDRLGVGQQPSARHVEGRQFVGEIPEPGADQPGGEGRFARPRRAREQNAGAVGLDRSAVEQEVVGARIRSGAIHVPDHPPQGVSGLLPVRQYLAVARHVERAAGRVRRRQRVPVFDVCGLEVIAQPAQRRINLAPDTHVVGTHRETVRQRTQVRGAMHPLALEPHRSGRRARILGRRRGRGRTAGPVVHGPSPGDQRRAHLGVALDVEAREGEGGWPGSSRGSRPGSRRGPACAESTRARPAWWMRPSPLRERRAWRRPPPWRSGSRVPPRLPHRPWQQWTCARSPGASRDGSSRRSPETLPHPPVSLRSACCRHFPHRLSEAPPLYLGIPTNRRETGVEAAPTAEHADARELDVDLHASSLQWSLDSWRRGRDQRRDGMMSA